MMDPELRFLEVRCQPAVKPDLVLSDGPVLKVSLHSWRINIFGYK